ncbi:hypothetical protein ACE1SV_41780 [Streptomyces sennicomposti]
MPTVAAATAAVERAFFGVAMRRMKETDTEYLLRRGRGIANSRSPRQRGRDCLAPRPLRTVGSLRRAPEKQPGKPDANTPFTSCRRIPDVSRSCERRLKAQVGAGKAAYMSPGWIYGRGS